MSACHHLNTDLELESSEDLTPIVEAFGADVIVLFHGKVLGQHRAAFEVAGLPADPDALIHQFCDLIEALPAPVRGVWDRCARKVFDVGFESGTNPPAFQTELRPQTVSRVAALGAGLVVTVYPP